MSTLVVGLETVIQKLSNINARHILRCHHLGNESKCPTRRLQPSIATARNLATVLYKLNFAIDAN